jgi:hypothetical protein
MTGPEEPDNPYPNSHFLTMSRVEANMPTETERRAAEYLYHRGWVNNNLSTDERNRARQHFIRGMQQGFKDRSYNFNWTVWRTEYERTGYPPGSFTPREPEGPEYRDPSVFQGTGGLTPAEERQLKRELRQNKGKGMRQFGQTGDQPKPTRPMRGFGQRGDEPNTSEPMRGFGESERKYRKRMETGRTEGTQKETSSGPTNERLKRKFGESERAYQARLRRQGDL